jgi:histone deacetylase complex regulatory component SIN3
LQKRLLPERDETYQQFLKIFADYVNCGRSIDEMQTCVKDLFKDERDLVDGFEKFLPKNNPRREGANVEVTKEGGLVK